ncbi:SET domain-containing protein [Auriscalpium vulgare]|uniref:SET domain-containing protein n=1 Tax=Auriscalpium vulgare TaxID=40419 RepID=A0ACB8S0L2_9AGAM|nr:SET domain-containing protein [Auriscalpium vulgare]
MHYSFLLQGAKLFLRRPSFVRAASTCSRPAISIPAPSLEDIGSPEPQLLQKMVHAVSARMDADPDFGLRYFVPPDQSTLLAYWPDLKDRLLERPGAFPPLNSIAARPSYEIRVVPGKGKSMFATEAIAPGALIARERPLLVAPALTPLKYSEERIHLSHMPENIRDKFLALHNCKMPSHPRGIMATNAFSAGNMPGQSHFGLYGATYNDISRANHSCRANARHRWNLDMFAGELRAQRAIAAGEEVTVRYSTDGARADRQEELRERYGFDCACEICSLPPAALARDDHTRKTLDDLWSLLLWGGSSCVQKLPSEVHLGCVSLLEGIRDETAEFWRVHAGELARAYCTLGQREDAVRWARKAMEKTMAVTGEDGGWAAVVEAPERTDVWRSQAVGK